MLDAISDFWKPSKKSDKDNAIDADSIKPGSTVGFGFVPQPEISGKRLAVKAINTYMFDADRMTSFALDAEGDAEVSLIIADGDQEKYIAVSRRIPFAERAALFDNNSLLACMGGDEKKRLPVKSDGQWSVWTVSEYKKAITGLKGNVTKGDYRGINALPKDAETRAFTYTLLVSSNNEYALEVEQYDDNKVEVYATVYRRLTDVGEIAPPQNQKQQKLSGLEAEANNAPAKNVAKTASELAALKPANEDNVESISKRERFGQVSKQAPTIDSGDAETKAAEVKKAPKIQTSTLLESVGSSSKLALKEINVSFGTSSEEAPKGGPLLSDEEEENSPSLATLPDAIEPVKDALPTLKPIVKEEHFIAEPIRIKETVEEAPQAVESELEVSVEAIETVQAQDTIDADPQETETLETQGEPAEMFASEMETTGIIEEQRTSFDGFNNQAEQTIKTTKTSDEKEQFMATSFNTNGAAEPKVETLSARAVQPQTIEVENDSVECELPAASRVIEEAIRNEMSMSDVIRRVVALPVARQESVSIPVMLTDSDYSLLAVRYGIPAADRAAIKAKIIEEIGEFSGK